MTQSHTAPATATPHSEHTTAARPGNKALCQHSTLSSLSAAQHSAAHLKQVIDDPPEAHVGAQVHQALPQPQLRGREVVAEQGLQLGGLAHRRGTAQRGGRALVGVPVGRTADQGQLHRCDEQRSGQSLPSVGCSDRAARSESSSPGTSRARGCTTSTMKAAAALTLSPTKVAPTLWTLKRIPKNTPASLQTIPPATLTICGLAAFIAARAGRPGRLPPTGCSVAHSRSASATRFPAPPPHALAQAMGSPGSRLRALHVNSMCGELMILLARRPRRHRQPRGSQRLHGFGSVG